MDRVNLAELDRVYEDREAYAHVVVFASYPALAAELRALRRQIAALKACNPHVEARGKGWQLRANLPADCPVVGTVEGTLTVVADHLESRGLLEVNHADV